MFRILGALVLVAAVVALAAFGTFHSKKSQARATAGPSQPVVAFNDTPDLSWPMMAPEQAPRDDKVPGDVAPKY